MKLVKIYMADFKSTKIESPKVPSTRYDSSLGAIFLHLFQLLEFLENVIDFMIIYLFPLIFISTIKVQLFVRVIFLFPLKLIFLLVKKNMTSRCYAFYKYQV